MYVFGTTSLLQVSWHVYMINAQEEHRLHLLEMIFWETRIAFGKVTRKSSYVVTICPELSFRLQFVPPEK